MNWGQCSDIKTPFPAGRRLSQNKFDDTQTLKTREPAITVDCEHPAPAVRGKAAAGGNTNAVNLPVTGNTASQ
jgi:hypothetical protein